MPVFNGMPFIRDSVNSILEQSLKEIELIVINDGSTDSTQEFLDSITDNRVRLIDLEENRGVAFCLNQGIRESRGEFIARMDADDIAFKDRLRKQVQFFDGNPDVSICGTSVALFGGSSGVVRYPRNTEEIKCRALFNSPFNHPSVMWRKKDFEDNDLWYQENPPTAEDYELWVRALKILKGHNLREVLLKYRVDFSIKLSGYVRQQLDGGREIRSHLLMDLGFERKDLEESMIHEVAEGNLEVSTLGFQEASKIMKKIIKKVTLSKFYDVSVVRSEITHQYWKFLKCRGVVANVSDLLPNKLNFSIKYPFELLRYFNNRYFQKS